MTLGIPLQTLSQLGEDEWCSYLLSNILIDVYKEMMEPYSLAGRESFQMTCDSYFGLE